MGKLQKFPGTFLLGMCLLTHGYYVHCWLRRRLCKNYPGPPVYGLLHPWWFGKNSSYYLFLLKILHATNHHTPPGVNKRRDALNPGRPSAVVYTEVFLWLTTSPQYVACHVLYELSTVLQHFFKYNAEVLFYYLLIPISFINSYMICRIFENLCICY